MENQSIAEENQFNQDETFFIKVSIPTPEEQKKYKYTVYCITGLDKNGNFSVIRRFSDFVNLRKSLVSRWPGLFIPGIPEKQLINKEEQVINKRKNELNEFCNQIFFISYLFYSQEFQVFLRFEDADKGIKSLQPQSIQDIIQKYKQIFNFLSGKEINSDLIQQIDEFKKQILVSKQVYKDVKANLSNAKKVQDSFDKEFSNDIILDLLIATYLHNYERQVIDKLQPVGQEIMSGIFSGMQNIEIQQYIQSFNEGDKINLFKELSNFIRFEQRTIEAFENCFEEKDRYETLRDKKMQQLKDLTSQQQNLLAGKKGFMQFIKQQSNADSLMQNEEAVIKAREELENLNLICDIITVIIGYIEIQTIKQNRVKLYTEMLIKASTQEQKRNQKDLNFWKQVALINPIIID